VEEVFQKLSEALPAWLSYQLMCGRKTLFSESYLAQPIGEVLRLEHNGDVHAEYDHPTIVSPGRGRPRQIDYVLLGEYKGYLSAGLEVKWVGNSPLSKQRLVDDLLRLECLRGGFRQSQSAHRYFLVAGGIAEMTTNFLDLTANSGGGRAPFVPFFLDCDSLGWKEVEVMDLPKFLRKYVKSFEQSFRVDSPKSFRTRLVADKVVGGFRSMLWRVDSGGGQRTTFNARKQWSDEIVPDTEDEDE